MIGYKFLTIIKGKLIKYVFTISKIETVFFLSKHFIGSCSIAYGCLYYKTNSTVIFDFN